MVLNMKKLAIVLSGVLFSTFVYADKPLNVQSGYSMPALESGQSANERAIPLAEKKSYSEWSNKRTNNTTSSLYAHYTQQNGKFSNDIDVDLKGGTIGFSTTPYSSGWWVEFEYLKNTEYSADYYEATFGGHYNIINSNGFYTLATTGMGVGVGSADGFDDTAYLTLPIGLEAGYSFAPNLSVFGGVGYKWNWEIKDNRTRCNDGTTSNSSGSGTCSWHGGVDTSYDYTIGDFDGLTYKAGIRYNF
ncbi:hypothetical protein F992_01622 [Acinetobacter modestus]|uniref:Porin family protein n=2 Tax=Acinetobacter modestus TaxID=1776740 RepID=A0ABN0JP15_9GAMM|nr:hypothetical protein F992_01622 [Acinetobacter modestus]GGA17746.1 hypothetical protein GCM10017554_13140 [Acinetobacter modestus]